MIYPQVIMDALALRINTTTNVAELIRLEIIIRQRLAHLCMERGCQGCDQCIKRPESKIQNPGTNPDTKLL